MKRTNLIVVGFAVLVLLLADAAFVGGRLLNQTAPIGGLVPGGASTRDGKTQTRIEIEPAEELPNSAPDAIGPFVERKVGMLKDVTVNAEPSHAHRAEQATPAYE